MDDKQWRWVSANFDPSLLPGEKIMENTWCSICGKDVKVHCLPNGELYCPKHEPEKRDDAKMQQVLKKFVGDNNG